MSLLSTAQHYDVLFIGGKGGVGKTTVSAALAVQLAAQQKRTLIISTDPAHSLGDALNVPLSGDITPINAHLSAVELNPDAILDAHFNKVADTMRSYAKPEMMPALHKHLRLARVAPGAQEAAMLEAICHYLVNFRDMGFAKLIFDTAPTGHTLRLMMLPDMMQAWTDSLLAQQSKQQNMRDAHRALIRQTPHQAPDDTRLKQVMTVLDERRALFAAARTLLHEGHGSAVFLVMIPEMLPLAETRRTHRQMRDFHLPLQGIIVNQVMAQEQHDPFWQQRAARQQDILHKISDAFHDTDTFYIPLQADDIRGTAALSRFKETRTVAATTPHQHH